ncbi:hypothetical protein A9404_12185 [Halothiobacillus diazotrophicus]|uniref:ApeI dehydratase-like domain-containing protein n=1 Tax=Halothiobacillus diazotrophicus TaxID=1860122 RepID=A0A191ZJK8_9GAMM|nr:hypothetical protein [Halothiobacillus diazotrophicus]ANJ68032.1 hypothetical protein A9404_12185 [Halothiobacillus diazotrophicus]
MSDAIPQDVPDRTAVRCLPDGHPVFAGHFPTQPIVPGALLLDMVLCHAAHRLSVSPTDLRIEQAKFLRPVSPGEAIDLTLQAPGDSALHRFNIRVGDVSVASGALSVRDLGSTGAPT